MTTLALLAGAYVVFVAMVLILLRAGAAADELFWDRQGLQRAEDDEPVAAPEPLTRSRRFRRSPGGDRIGTNRPR